MPSSVTAPAADRAASETTLGRVSVVRIAWEASWKLGGVGREPAEAPLEARLEPVHRQLVADHAGRGDEDLRRLGSPSAAAASVGGPRGVRLALGARSPRWRCRR